MTASGSLPASALLGYMPALPTPFDEAGHLDHAALENFCERLIQAGANALVVCGTTGEASTLTPAEHDEVVATAADVSSGRVPVVAGIGSNSTEHAIELARQAENAGADALLAVTPYYNRPTQAGLYAHFMAISETVGLPILLYDVPSRTAVALADTTVARLAETGRFAGLKDATGDIVRPLRLRPMVGAQFRLLSGEDSSVLAFLAHGGDGCISVTANVAPGLCNSLYRAWKDRRISDAQHLAQAAADLTAALFIETSPGPVKYMLSLMNIMAPSVRLPLVEPGPDARDEIAAALMRVFKSSPGYLIGRPLGESFNAVRPIRALAS